MRADPTTTPDALRAPDAPPPAVCVVDDDRSARRGMARLLRSAGYSVEVFETARAYLEGMPTRPCSCLVLDVRMPGPSGLDLQDALADGDHAPSIVFVTGHGDIPTSVRAMKKGATDFLTKSIDEADFLRAVRHAVARCEDKRLALGRAMAARNLIASLTSREREVLGLVAAGLLNKNIAARLGITEATVKVHRGRVMRKLGVRSVADLVRVVESAGGTAR